MTRNTPLPHRARLGLILCTVVALGACSETGEFSFGSRNADADGPAAIGATRLIERDVEAPEVFQVTDQGLWDGRPSLGGVWVAHPDATDPERVIIRNEENGRFVIGALFRRERENPGPIIQISSDAAAALEILAGDPATIQVTALRREEVEEPDPDSMASADPEAAALPEGEAPATLAAAAITAEPLDPIAEMASGAIAESEAAIPAPTPASLPTGSALDRPFVQIGIFSVQENANNTAQALRNVGLVPTIYDQESNGRRFWRVVVGPAPTASDRAAVLESVRELGFEDAYFVTR
ncbi:SPOR domain-containing protein [Maritalea mobilis]|uniref:SPOR domain-containing protein n=1 Tax=Maritalea mobilis TaxID=483324 RepID=UPI001C948FFF|nr:SPOR domain-containing protein [Maritalea mobilis]MBY6201056.1 SPOR domain-containing protein [Maritalea mobilis]